MRDSQLPRCFRAVTILVTWAASAAAQATSGAATLPAIAADSIRVHIRALADDRMEGRGTGTRGYARAATYVEARFAAYGLAPGASGGWLQQVPLIRRTVPRGGASFTVVSATGPGRTYALGDEFVLTRPGDEAADLETPVVFVGYGLTIPTRAHDDYTGLDARGKIVAFVPGTPAGLSLDERTYLGTMKEQNAIAHGAIGTLRLWTPEEEKAATWKSAVESYDAAGLFTWAPDTVRSSAARPANEHAWLGPEASAQLFSGAARSYAEMMANPVPSVLPVHARLTVRGRATSVASPNVVGVLRGSDPTLRDEYVAVTAHLDHLGIGKAIGGDSIYNGAVDNASGVAALLELARAFAAMPDRPRRSVLFIAFTGEETGNIGSAYFVSHPPFAISSVVANVNIDGVSVWPFDGLVPRGAEHSSISRAADSALARVGVRVSPDPTPGRASLAGSDQYSFLAAGVPAVIFGAARSGLARERAVAWVRDRYHAPSDDLSQPMDFAAAAEFTSALLAVTRTLAGGGERPRWNAQDFFSQFVGPTRP